MSEKLLHRFYGSFQQRDYEGMNACYTSDARFTDPVFRDLEAEELKAMWEMLCKRGKDLKIHYNIIRADAMEGIARWTASYTFSATGKKVINHVTSRFQFSDGKIRRQEDEFDFYKWSRQALGTSGWLLGWTPFYKNKVRKKAMDSLQRFILSSKTL